MTGLQFKLSALLLLQLAVATAFFLFDRQQQGQYLQTAVLLDFQQQQLNKIEIDANDGSVLLSKENGSWQLPTLESLPVDDNKLNRLLARLQTLKVGWPTTITDASHQRFNVAEDQFLRRIRLYQGDILAAELFIGTAPHFRKAYIRRANDDAVYVAELNTYDLPVDANAWLDKSLLAAGDEIDMIQAPGYKIEKSADQWTFIGDRNSEQENKSAKKQALALIKLQVQQAADTMPAIAEENTTTIKASGGSNHWTYQFMQVDDSYYVRRNDHDTTFTLSKLDYQGATGIDLEQKEVSTNDAVKK